MLVLGLGAALLSVVQPRPAAAAPLHPPPSALPPEVQGFWDAALELIQQQIGGALNGR